MNTIWKDVIDFKGYYQVSNKGDVRSINRVIPTSNGKSYKLKGKVLAKTLLKVKNHSPRYIIALSLNGVSKNYYISRLVCSAFNENPHNLPQVNHIDGNSLNNNVENLEWVDNYTNMTHAINNGLIRKKIKPRLLQKDEVIDIYKSTLSINELCNKYDVKKCVVHKIRYGVNYTHITNLL